MSCHLSANNTTCDNGMCNITPHVYNIPTVVIIVCVHVRVCVVCVGVRSVCDNICNKANEAVRVCYQSCQQGTNTNNSNCTSLTHENSLDISFKSINACVHQILFPPTEYHFFVWSGVCVCWYSRFRSSLVH